MFAFGGDYSAPLNIGVARIFDWGGANHNLNTMTSSEFFEKETFCGKKILKIGRSETLASMLAHSQDFATRKGLRPTVKSVNVKIGRRIQQTNVTRLYQIRESGECRWITISTCLETFERTTPVTKCLNLMCFMHLNWCWYTLTCSNTNLNA